MASVPGLEVRRRLPSRARDNKTRLQFPEEGGVLGKRLRELLGYAALGGGLARKVAQAFRAALDDAIALGHFFAGGASPVATRQIFDATRRAPMVAAAPRPA